jgi:hypothetical protein
MIPPFLQPLLPAAFSDPAARVPDKWASLSGRSPLDQGQSAKSSGSKFVHHPLPSAPALPEGIDVNPDG